MAGSALESYLQQINELMADEGVTEITINKPGEIIIEGSSGKQFIEADFDHAWLSQLSSLIANYTGQNIGKRNPLLSANLPGGERIQIVMPPAVEQGQFAMSIRKPMPMVRDLGDYAAEGALVVQHVSKSMAVDSELLRLKKEGDIEGFLRLAVKSRKNILVSGGTDSGKTTFCNSLIRETDPDDRIITIEDVREIRLEHKDSLHLLYSKGGQGEADITPQDLLEVCLRLKPKRIFVAELRGGEAFYFLRAAISGHPGTLATLHAGSAHQAFDQLVLMVQQSGVDLTAPQIREFLAISVDIVTHWEKDEKTGQRKLVEILFNRETS